tara:strand:- start:1359 stop:1733 length:375 start_codon:yes stop_codon:yes gene_type:complete
VTDEDFQFDEELFKSETDSGTGETVMVSFRLKREDGAVLQQIVNAMPYKVSKSELLRELVMPYIAALKLAKEGKNWQGALEFGKQLSKLSKGLKAEAKKQAEERNQTKLDFNPPSVTEVPNLST